MLRIGLFGSRLARFRRCMCGRCGGGVVDPAEPRIRELLQATPTMAATVIAERIDWPFSIRILRDRVSKLRPVYRA